MATKKQGEARDIKSMEDDDDKIRAIQTIISADDEEAVLLEEFDAVLEFLDA